MAQIWLSSEGFWRQNTHKVSLEDAFIDLEVLWVGLRWHLNQHTILCCRSPSRGGSLIPLIIICVLIYLVYAVCIAPLQVRQTPRPEADIREGQQQERELTNRNTNVQQGPGFWTGAGIGGILGGLFGLGAYIGQDYYLQVSGFSSISSYACRFKLLLQVSLHNVSESPVQF